MAAWLRRNLCQRGQWTRQRRLFYLEGDPKALSSRARSTAQAPAPGREHRHFVRVRINASKTTATSETGGQALRTQCIYGSFRNHSPLRNQGAKHCVRNAKKELDQGPLTTPKPPLGILRLRNHCPSETRGLTISDATNIILQALRTQCKEELDRGPLTTPKPLIAPPLAPPTPAKNGGPSKTAVRSDTGGGQSPRLHSACGYIITLFLPHFCPFFTPLLPPKGKMPRFYPVFTPFLPRSTCQFLPLGVKAG